MKHFEIQVSAEASAVEETIEGICDKLLANVNMETYRYEIEQLEGI